MHELYLSNKISSEDFCWYSNTYIRLRELKNKLNCALQEVLLQKDFIAEL